MPPPSRFSACVHRPLCAGACVYVCAWRCASSSVSPLHGTRARTMHVTRAPKSLHVRVSMPNIGVTQCPVRQSSKCFRETPRMLQHARRRSGAPFDDDGCRPSVLYLPVTTHILYPPSSHSVSAASFSHESGRLCHRPPNMAWSIIGMRRTTLSLPARALLGRSVWVNRYCITSRKASKTKSNVYSTRRSFPR